MSKRRITVFFYGLFMDADLLRSKEAQPTNIRPGSITGFALRIGARATLVPASGGRAHGVLMDLAHDEIDRLYSEPSVQMYRPEPVMAEEVDGSPVAALCYNLIEPPKPEERNEAYAARLRDLAVRLKLPSDYIATIR